MTHRRILYSLRRVNPEAAGFLVPAMIVAALGGARVSEAADWPTYRHDPGRSGVTSEKLVPPLERVWVHRAKYPPQPAWAGPARRDGWHKTENLKPRAIFDWAFHVTSNGESVFFGSSADDKIYCLDAETGKERWSVFAGGPIRLAPTLSDGKVYVGSDDGVVYCLSASDGKLIWKHKAAPTDYRIAGNESFMSVWPIRSGVIVDDGKAYFCAGLFAFEGAYLCSVNAADGSETWKKKFGNLCPQGYMLASKDRLYVPAGGGSPGVFNRKTGRFLYELEGSGGTFAVLSDEALIYGPGKVGTLKAYKAGAKDQIASFPGNQIVITPKMSYLHTDTELSALDRIRYLDLSEQRYKLNKRIESYKKQIKKHDPKIDYDPPNSFRIGTYKDNDENFVFKGQIGDVRVWSTCRDAAAIKANMNKTLVGKPKELIGYWKLSEGAGEAVVDAIGKSNGKLVKGPKWASTDSAKLGPPSGQSLVFDGTMTYVEAGKDAILRPAERVTVEAWIKAEAREKWSGIAGNIWDSGSTEGGYGLTLDAATGAYFGLKTGSHGMIYLSSGANTVRLGQWHHVAGTYDGGHMKIYIDGELKASREVFSAVASPEKLAAKIKELEAMAAKIAKELPKCVGWRRPCKYPYSLILAGEVLYAGGTDGVAAFQVADGKTIWTEKVQGRALDLAVANGRLLVSTDRGVIHCFAAK